MIELVLIGAGTGHPDHLTLQGVRALQEADLVLIPRKGAGKEDLAHLRRAMLDRHRPGGAVAEIDLPVRDANLPYLEAVDRWHDAIAQVWAGAVAAALPQGGTVAMLVWGDPSLYDSSIRIIEAIAARRSDFAYDVIPGITSLQALTARHRIPLNSIGRAVEITTGRLLAEGWPQGVDSVAVMLDAKDTYRRFVGQGLHIYWGAYVGTADEILIAGPLDEVAERIVTTRAEARERNGWIMDSYLLRKEGMA